MTNKSERNSCTPPYELLIRSVTLAGELSWPLEDARTVIAWLSNNNCAIVGVELWKDDNGLPKWIASSNYSCEADFSWTQYVTCCSEGAMEFVKRFESEFQGLFNLNWMSEDEVSNLR